MSFPASILSVDIIQQGMPRHCNGLAAKRSPRNCSLPMEETMSRFLVKAGIFLASVAVLLAGCHSASEVQGGVPLVAPLRIDGVTIVDTRDGKLTPGMSILMDHGEIAAITPTSSTSDRKSTRLNSSHL